QGGDSRSLMELRGGGRAYPLYGIVPRARPQRPEAGVDRRLGKFRAALGRAVVDRRGLGFGDGVTVEEANFELRATLKREPAAAAGGLELGPRVIVSTEALAESGLIRPGALVTYHYRLQLPRGVDPAFWAARVQTAFPEAGWQVRTFDG